MQYREFTKIVFKHQFKNEVLQMKLEEIRGELREMQQKVKNKDDIQLHVVKNVNKAKQQASPQKSNKTMNLDHFKRSKTEESKYTSKMYHQSRLSQHFKVKDSHKIVIHSS